MRPEMMRGGMNVRALIGYRIARIRRAVVRSLVALALVAAALVAVQYIAGCAAAPGIVAGAVSCEIARKVCQVAGGACAVVSPPTSGGEEHAP